MDDNDHGTVANSMASSNSRGSYFLNKNDSAIYRIQSKLLATSSKLVEVGQIESSALSGALSIITSLQTLLLPFLIAVPWSTELKDFAYALEALHLPAWRSAGGTFIAVWVSCIFITMLLLVIGYLLGSTGGDVLSNSSSQGLESLDGSQKFFATALSYLLRIQSGPLYIPILRIVLSSLECENFSAGDDSSVCGVVGRVIMSSLTAIFALVIIAQSTYYTVFVFPRDLVSFFPWARGNGRAHGVIKVGIGLACVVVQVSQQFTTTFTFIVAGVVVTACFIIPYLVLAYLQPYYTRSSNNIAAAWLASCVWACASSILAKLVDDSSSSISMAVALGGLLPAAIAGYLGCDWRYRALCPLADHDAFALRPGPVLVFQGVGRRDCMVIRLAPGRSYATTTVDGEKVSHRRGISFADMPETTQSDGNTPAVTGPAKRASSGRRSPPPASSPLTLGSSGPITTSGTELSMKELLKRGVADDDDDDDDSDGSGQDSSQSESSDASSSDFGAEQSLSSRSDDGISEQAEDNDPSMSASQRPVSPELRVVVDYLPVYDPETMQSTVPVVRVSSMVDVTIAVRFIRNYRHEVVTDTSAGEIITNIAATILREGEAHFPRAQLSSMLAGFDIINVSHTESSSELRMRMAATDTPLNEDVGWDLDLALLLSLRRSEARLRQMALSGGAHTRKHDASFNRRFDAAINAHEDALSSMNKFWTALLSRYIDLSVLARRSEQISASIRRAEMHFKWLLHKNPKSTRVVRAFAFFTESIHGEKNVAEHLYGLADTFEDMQQQDNQNLSHGMNSSLGSSALGDGTKGFADTSTQDVYHSQTFSDIAAEVHAIEQKIQVEDHDPQVVSDNEEARKRTVVTRGTQEKRWKSWFKNIRSRDALKFTLIAAFLIWTALTIGSYSLYAEYDRATRDYLEDVQSEDQRIGLAAMISSLSSAAASVAAGSSYFNHTLSMYKDDLRAAGLALQYHHRALVDGNSISRMSASRRTLYIHPSVNLQYYEDASPPRRTQVVENLYDVGFIVASSALYLANAPDSEWADIGRNTEFRLIQDNAGSSVTFAFLLSLSMATSEIESQKEKTTIVLSIMIAITVIVNVIQVMFLYPMYFGKIVADRNRVFKKFTSLPKTSIRKLVKKFAALQLHHARIYSVMEEGDQYDLEGFSVPLSGTASVASPAVTRNASGLDVLLGTMSDSSDSGSDDAKQSPVRPKTLARKLAKVERGSSRGPSRGLDTVSPIQPPGLFKGPRPVVTASAIDVKVRQEASGGETDASYYTTDAEEVGGTVAMDFDGIDALVSGAADVDPSEGSDDSSGSGHSGSSPSANISELLDQHFTAEGSPAESSSDDEGDTDHQGSPGLNRRAKAIDMWITSKGGAPPSGPVKPFSEGISPSPSSILRSTRTPGSTEPLVKRATAKGPPPPPLRQQPVAVAASSTGASVDWRAYIWAIVTVLIAFMVLGLTAALVSFAVQGPTRSSTVLSAYETHDETVYLGRVAMRNSDSLTRDAQAFVSLGRWTAYEQYWALIASGDREAVQSRLLELGITGDEQLFMGESKSNSDGLIRIETIAFLLAQKAYGFDDGMVPEIAGFSYNATTEHQHDWEMWTFPNRRYIYTSSQADLARPLPELKSMARSLMYDELYWYFKGLIMEPVNVRFFNSVHQRMNEATDEAMSKLEVYDRLQLVFAIIITVGIAFVMFVIFRTLHLSRTHDQKLLVSYLACTAILLLLGGLCTILTIVSINTESNVPANASELKDFRETTFSLRQDVFALTDSAQMFSQFGDYSAFSDYDRAVSVGVRDRFQNDVIALLGQEFWDREIGPVWTDLSRDIGYVEHLCNISVAIGASAFATVPETSVGAQLINLNYNITRDMIDEFLLFSHYQALDIDYSTPEEDKRRYSDEERAYLSRSLVFNMRFTEAMDRYTRLVNALETRVVNNLRGELRAQGDSRGVVDYAVVICGAALALFFTLVMLLAITGFWGPLMAMGSSSASSMSQVSEAELRSQQLEEVRSGGVFKSRADRQAELDKKKQENKAKKERRKARQNTVSIQLFRKLRTQYIVVCLALTLIISSISIAGLVTTSRTSVIPRQLPEVTRCRAASWQIGLYSQALLNPGAGKERMRTFLRKSVADLQTARQILEFAATEDTRKTEGILGTLGPGSDSDNILTLPQPLICDDPIVRARRGFGKVIDRSNNATVYEYVACVGGGQHYVKDDPDTKKGLDRIILSLADRGDVLHYAESVPGSSVASVYFGNIASLLYHAADSLYTELQRAYTDHMLSRLTTGRLASLILFIVTLVLLPVILIFIFRPMMIKITQEDKRTESMLSMIPRKYARGTKKLTMSHDAK